MSTRTSAARHEVTPEALDLSDSARFLGLKSADAARGLGRVGKMQPARLGRRLVIPIEELRRLLRESQGA